MTHTTPNFGDFQLEIYLRGLSGVRENQPLTYAEFEARAHAALPPDILSYVAGGAGNEYTQEANVTAFDPPGPHSADAGRRRSARPLDQPVREVAADAAAACSGRGHRPVRAGRARRPRDRTRRGEVGRADDRLDAVGRSLIISSPSPIVFNV